MENFTKVMFGFKEVSVMRVASLIIGVIGGIAGFGGAIFALFVGGLDATFSASGTSSIVGLGVAAIFFSLLGLVGGTLALNKPRIAGVMMLVAAIGGVISVSWGYVVAFPTLLVGGILALISQKKRVEQMVDKEATQ
jgi:hypothetical protein